MKLCRFTSPSHPWPCVGLVQDSETLLDLSVTGVRSLSELLEVEHLSAHLRELGIRNPPRVAMASVTLLAPVDQQEVWAAGVTYLRSKTARMEESEFSANAYDRVYDASRPELFFKSSPTKVIGPGGAVCIRADARWSVPEPELVLVLDSRGRVAGYTIGNDMSSRDIEGENLLYLPQAKVYRGSCAIGPFIAIGDSEETVRKWEIQMRIYRGGKEVFHGTIAAGQLKRGFAELAGWLFRSQEFPGGALLLTGTGIVPPENFTLEAGDEVEISISGIGTLKNRVAVA